MNRQLFCLISLLSILSLFAGSGGVLAQDLQPPVPYGELGQQGTSFRYDY